MRKLPNVVRVCIWCELPFQLNSADAKRTGKRYQRFCSRACSKFGASNPMWKTGSITAATGRNRAQYRFKNLGQCQRCDKPAMDRHHKDGNTGNNDATNVEFLCRRCHMLEDGRLKALIDLIHIVQPAGAKSAAKRRTEVAQSKHI
jgi:hypothetical protein